MFSTAKNKLQGSGEVTLELQKQDANNTALIASVNKLQQEKKQLQKERDELLAKLATKITTKGTHLHTAIHVPVCALSHILSYCHK